MGSAASTAFHSSAVNVAPPITVMNSRRFTQSPRRRYLHDQRHGEAERLCRLEIDRQLEFHSLLHRQVGWLLPFENAPSVRGLGIKQHTTGNVSILSQPEIGIGLFGL